MRKEAPRQMAMTAEEGADKPGVQQWELKLAPRGKQEIKISYCVKHPEK
ncbi:MAG: DUF4139 domain-containing protein [Candidatus Omnitrophica bacterium]|nr:DUF4139 domain-containing protein [Candidatus Omnitrophota bacterium]